MKGTKKKPLKRSLARHNALTGVPVGQELLALASQYNKRDAHFMRVLAATVRIGEAQQLAQMVSHTLEIICEYRTDHRCADPQAILPGLAIAARNLSDDLHEIFREVEAVK